MTGATLDGAREAVTGYLARFVDDPSSLSGPLISSGLLDSLVAVELISFLEARFGITVVDDDLDIANFDTVDGVLAFLARKTGGA